MNVRHCVEHEVSITKTLRGFHFVKVVGATPWLCQWHGLQDMTEASSFHQLRLQMHSLGHVYMVAYILHRVLHFILFISSQELLAPNPKEWHSFPSCAHIQYSQDGGRVVSAQATLAPCSVDTKPLRPCGNMIL